MIISLHAQHQFDDYELFSKTMDDIITKFPKVSQCLYGRSKMEEFAKKYFKDSNVICNNPRLSRLKIQNLYKIVEKSNLSIFFYNNHFTGGYMATKKTINHAKNLGKDFLVVSYIIESNEQYYDIVRKEIQIFVKKYQKNPFNFLTEYDLQGYLFSKIFDSFENKGIQVEIETTGKNEPIKRWKKNESLTISTNPTRTEYPARYLFDIAVIDNNDLVKKVSAYWHQKLKIGIEIKYHRCSANSIFSKIKKFKLDIKKLEKYQLECNPKDFRGLSILFIQNDNENMEKKFENNIFNNYKKANLEQIIYSKGVEGLVVTKSHCFYLAKK